MKPASGELEKRWRYFVERYWRFIRSTHLKLSNGHISLKKLPWYLLIGAHSSGKTQFIQQADLNFIQSNDPELNQNTPSSLSKWWITQKGTWLELPHLLWKNVSNAHSKENHWSMIMGLLSRYWKRKPLAGIFITLDLVHFCLQPRNEQALLLNDLKCALLRIADRLNHTCPIYLIGTKLDKVAGFNEFFDNLDENQRNRLWGLSLRSEDQTESYLSLFQHHYQQLIKQLHLPMMMHLHQEQHIPKRLLIEQFPIQLEYVHQTLTYFIQELCTSFSSDQLFFKGLYFTSALQQGNSVNFLQKTIQEELQTSSHREIGLTSKSGRTPYFIHDLFHELLSKHNTVQTKNRWETQPIFRKCVYIGCAGLLLISGGVMAYRTTYEIDQIEKAQQALITYHQLAENLPANTLNLNQTLPLLNTLQHATQVITQIKLPWLMAEGLHLPSLQALAIATYQKALVHYFLPGLALMIQHDLLIQSDPTFLYGALKIYLMLGDPSHLDSAFVQNWLSHHWEESFANDPYLAHQLSSHLHALLSQPIPPTSIDAGLVSQIRIRLITLTPEQLALIILENQTDNRYLSLSQLLHTSDQTLQTVFNNQTNTRLLTIYTLQQLPTIYAQTIPQAIDFALNGDWVLGAFNNSLSLEQRPALLNQVRNDYLLLYKQAWANFISQLSLAPWQNWEQAETSLNYLAQHIVIFNQLAHLIETNTEAKFITDNNNLLNSNDEIVIGHYLDNTYSNSNNTDIDLSHMVNPLQGLQRFLAGIANSSDSELAAYQALSAQVQTQSNPTPINILILKAAGFPNPIRAWFDQIAANSIALMSQQARVFLNQQWQTHVVSFYNAKLNNRYPLVDNANVDISLTDFANFFAANGLINQFVEMYLHPFINVHQTEWQWQTVNGLSLGFSSQFLLALERAAMIQAMFFPNQQFRSEFTLTPIAFSPSVTRMELNLDGQIIQNSRHIKTSETLYWPTFASNSYINLTFINNRNENTTQTLYGPWALFKLLSKANLEPTQNTQQFLLTFDLNGDSARYELTATSPLNPFIPNILDEFQCPNSL